MNEPVEGRTEAKAEGERVDDIGVNVLSGIVLARVGVDVLEELRLGARVDGTKGTLLSSSTAKQLMSKGRLLKWKKEKKGETKGGCTSKFVHQGEDVLVNQRFVLCERKERGRIRSETPISCNPRTSTKGRDGGDVRGCQTLLSIPSSTHPRPPVGADRVP